MFESAEIGHKLSKGEYKAIEPQLRAALLEAQVKLSERGDFPVIILISGVRGAGKGETVNLLNEWMDPRHIRTIAFDTPTDEERARPPMWRFWRALPPKGKIGILFGSWYTAPIIDRVFKTSKKRDLAKSIERIRQFEAMLAQDGALIIKFWFHLSETAQRKRLKALESDPKTRWRVTDRDWSFFKHYRRFTDISGEVLEETSTAHAPWLVVEGSDPEYRAVMVGKVLLEAINKRLAMPKGEAAVKIATPPLVEPADHLHTLDTLNLKQSVPKEKYEREVARLQARMGKLTRHPKFAERSIICAFEGMDAAGKGGAIRRIAGALDARLYNIIPVAAPTDEERAQSYLWRFWRHLPGKGRITIYDRSWYGRVLVERVEKFCSEADWMRAYGEINEFEEEIAENGGIVTKFWLQISPEEQLRRFKEREKIKHKNFKITPEDWRNRDKWDAYQRAASDMIERTHTKHAPWVMVEANDKYFARVKILKALVERVEAQLEGKG